MILKLEVFIAQQFGLEVSPLNWLIEGCFSPSELRNASADCSAWEYFFEIMATFARAVQKIYATARSRSGRAVQFSAADNEN